MLLKLKKTNKPNLIVLCYLAIALILSGLILSLSGDTQTAHAEEPASYTVDMSAYERVSESSPDIMRVPYYYANYSGGTPSGYIDVPKSFTDDEYVYCMTVNDQKLHPDVIDGYADGLAFFVNPDYRYNGYLNIFEYYAPEYYSVCAKRGDTINYYDGETLINTQNFGGKIAISKYLKNGVAPKEIEIFRTGKYSARTQIETADYIICPQGSDNYIIDVYLNFSTIEHNIAFNYNGQVFNKTFTKSEITLTQSLLDEITQNVSVPIKEEITSLFYSTIDGEVSFKLGDTINFEMLPVAELNVKTTAYPQPTEKPLTVEEDFLQDTDYFLHNPFDASNVSPSVVRVTAFGDSSAFSSTRTFSINFTKYTLPLGGYMYITKRSEALESIEQHIERANEQQYYKKGYTISHDFNITTIENEEYWTFKDSRTYQKNDLYYSSIYEIGIHLINNSYTIEYKQNDTLLYRDKVLAQSNYTFKDIRKDKFYAPTLLYYATRNGVTTETDVDSILAEILTASSTGASGIVFTVQLDYVRLPYEITFIWGKWFNGLQVNWWQTETIKVIEGDTPTPPPPPNLSGTEWEHLAFIGWDKPFAPATEDTTYKVVTKEITFDVTYSYLNSKGESVTQVKQTLKGRKPIDFSLNDETKDPLLYFYFDSWDSAEPIRSNKTITAMYKYHPLVRFRQVLGSTEVKTYDLDFTEYNGLYTSLPKKVELPKIADFVAWKEYSGSNLPSGYKGYISYPKSENFELSKITFTFGDKTIDKQIDVDLSSGEYYYIFNAVNFEKFLNVSLKKYKVHLTFNGKDVLIFNKVAKLNFDGNTPQSATLTVTKIPSAWDKIGNDWKNAFTDMGNGFKFFGGWINKYYTNLSSSFKKVWNETLNLSKNIGTLANKLITGAGKIVDGLTSNTWVIVVIVIIVVVIAGGIVFLIILAKNRK